MSELSDKAKRVIAILRSDETPNYAALINDMPELFAPKDEWTKLSTQTAGVHRYYPKFNEDGKRVFVELYNAGEVVLEFPGLTPDTLQNYAPLDMKTRGAIGEGIYLSSEVGEDNIKPEYRQDDQP